MTDFLNDTFTEVGDRLITAHTPETGGAWVFNTSYGSTVSQSETLALDTAASLSVPENDAQSVGDHYVEAVFDLITDLGNWGITCRGQTGRKFYMARMNAGSLQLYYIANTGTYLISSVAFVITAGNTYTLRLSVADNAGNVDINVDVDGINRISVTDSSATKITANGKAGLWLSSGTNTTTGVNVLSIVGADLAAATNTITLTDIDDNKVIQRATTNAAVTVTGLYTGTPTNIEVKIVLDGTSTIVHDWQTLEAAPTGGTFSGTVNVNNGGPYNVQVRFSNDMGVQSNGTNGWLVGDLIVCAGQSNIWYWFNDTGAVAANAQFRIYNDAGNWAVAGAAAKGAVAFANKLITNSAVPVGLVDSTSNGSALRQATGSPYWLTTADARGTDYINFQSDLLAIGGSVAGFIWAQGEAEANSGVTSELEYKTSLQALLSFVRTDTADASLPVVIVYMGVRTTAIEADVQAIRAAQRTVIESSVNNYGVTAIDLPLRDTVHYSDHTKIGQRCAQVFAFINGDETYFQSPQAQSAVKVDSTTIDVTITHFGGADFTPTTGITGFEVFDDGIAATISSAVRQSATLVRLSLSAALTGTATVRCLYGNADVSGIVLDNAAMQLPLESFEAVAIPKKVTLTLTDPASTPEVSLTGLKWAFFDEATPDLLNAPVDKGSIETTDASGVIDIPLPNTALAIGANGWVIVTDADGTTTQSPAHKAFTGVVEVTQ